MKSELPLRDVNPEDLGIPSWAWPLLGLTAGILLVIVVHGTCFIDPDC